MNDCYVETSYSMAIIHKESKISRKVRRDQTNFPLTAIQAKALMDCRGDGHDGPVWCDECFPNRSPSY